MVYIILMCITCFIYFLFMTLLAVCVCVSLSVLSESATPWTVAHQAPLSKGFSRQEYWRVRLLTPKLQRLSQHLRKPQSKGSLLKFG